MATYQSWTNQMKVCPYDPNHKISATKFASHIIKCAKKPELPALMECPFNAEHRLDPKDYATHLEICPNQDLTEASRKTKAKPLGDELDEGDWD